MPGGRDTPKPTVTEAALAGPLAAGPNLRESCMRSKGWDLVERRRVN